jgi:hypothetical protein
MRWKGVSYDKKIGPGFMGSLVYSIITLWWY